MRWCTACAFLSLVASCASAPTEIVLDIDGIRVDDETLRRDGLDELQIRVRHLSNSFEQEQSLDLSSRWLPAVAPIVHRSGPLGIYRIAVVGLLEGVEVISVSRDEVFEAGRSRGIAIVLEAACYDVRCAEEETCMDGVCRPIPRPTPFDPGVDASADTGTGDGATDIGTRVDAGPPDTGFDVGAVDVGARDVGPGVDTGVPGDEWFAGECAEAGPRCDDSCTSSCECDANPCAVRCTSGCTVECKNGHPCSVELAAGASTVICDGNCDVVVRDGASVDAQCKNDSPCVFRCEAGSTCVVDCQGEEARCRIECAAGANCTLRGCEEGTRVDGTVHRCRAD